MSKWLILIYGFILYKFNMGIFENKIIKKNGRRILEAPLKNKNLHHQYPTLIMCNR